MRTIFIMKRIWIPVYIEKSFLLSTVWNHISGHGRAQHFHMVKDILVLRADDPVSHENLGASEFHCRSQVWFCFSPAPGESTQALNWPTHSVCGKWETCQCPCPPPLTNSSSQHSSSPLLLESLPSYVSKNSTHRDLYCSKHWWEGAELRPHGAWGFYAHLS